LSAKLDAAPRKPRAPRVSKTTTPRRKAKAAPASDTVPDTGLPPAEAAAPETVPTLTVEDAMVIDAIEVAPVETPEPVTAEDDLAHPTHVAGGQGGEEIPAAPAAIIPELPLFSELGLCEPIQRAIDEMGYRHPTPIQAQAIPHVLTGQDVLGVAQTGTGKTASFTLPMLEILQGSRARARMPRSLILEPTRELALQVAENFVMYGKHLRLTHALLIGGESMADQKEALNRGVDVLIATPGRLIDLFERGGLLLTQTRVLVIDEADRMLDMGFIPDIERIVSMLSPIRQTMLFSATMAPEIRRLADAFLRNPKEITVSRPSSVATTIESGLLIVDEEDKRRALRKMLRTEAVQNAIVFCNRKRDVDILHKSLSKHGFSVGALHGDLPQSVRFSTLEKFKADELKILVCSDVAARGIDIGGLSHVFNFDVPFHAEDYVHRIGRTGRAGRSGHAYSLATPYERNLVEAIEKLTGKPIPLLEIEGVATLPFTDEKRPRNDRDRGGKDSRKRGRNGHDTRREERPVVATESVVEQVVPEPAPVEVPRETRVRDERPRNDRAPREERPRDERPRDDRNRDRRPSRHDRAVDEADSGVIGFGAEVPAFMLLPRRKLSRTTSGDAAIVE